MMNTCRILGLLAMLLAAGGAAAQEATTSRGWNFGPEEHRLGGPATVDAVGVNAFSYPARVLDARGRRAFAVGNAFFKDNWVMAPSSTEGRDGLGPLFNAPSCSACHLRDGRSRPPEPDEIERSGLLLRLGVPGPSGDLPHPVYGGQLQDRALPGIAAEGVARIRYEVVTGHFDDGQPYELLKPSYEIGDPAYGAPGPDLRLGARVAPHLIGLGLLEAISADDLRARADPDDEDGDGISGRVHVVLDRVSGRKVPGRFGWKATQPTVLQQSADAFLNDIGITSELFPEHALTPAQRERIVAASGGEPELSARKLDFVAHYCRMLAVPALRDPSDPRVRRGRRIFEELRCSSCHVPEQRTGSQAEVPAYRDRVFRPFTDLLLHDMGPGLADGKHDGEAAPSEWRTPPLWGIGLFRAVSGHTRYLHDGRARDLQEAILWHGGEAAASRGAFLALPRPDRDALLAFLNAL